MIRVLKHHLPHNGPFYICKGASRHRLRAHLLGERRIPGRMLIGAPIRDFLIAFSERNQKQAALMGNQVRKDARRMPRPLSGRLLVWEDGDLREH